MDGRLANALPVSISGWPLSAPQGQGCKKKISLVNIQHSKFEQMEHFGPVTSQQHILEAATCF